MSKKKRQGSRELGLLLARTLLGVDDLHYGLWESDLALSAANLLEAQQRYSNLLLGNIEDLTRNCTDPVRILDVGCGTGHLLEQMLGQGYSVDAVNPSGELNKIVKERVSGISENRFQLVEKAFENLSSDDCPGPYDVILFSESFQYIPLPALFDGMPPRLSPSGVVIIADFFKTDAHCDGAVGDRSMSGGHILSEFYRYVEESGLEIEKDVDLTSKVSPNLELMDEWLQQRIAPAAGLTGDYLLRAYPVLSRMLRWVLRRKLQRLEYKYFSGNRGKAVFEKYKSYRLLVLTGRV